MFNPSVGLDFSARSLNQAIREANGIEPSRAECLLHAVTTNPRTADLLGLTAQGGPMTRKERTDPRI